MSFHISSIFQAFSALPCYTHEPAIVNCSHHLVMLISQVRILCIPSAHFVFDKIVASHVLCVQSFVIESIIWKTNILMSQAERMFPFTTNLFNQCSSLTANTAFHEHADKMPKLLHAIHLWCFGKKPNVWVRLVNLPFSISLYITAGKKFPTLSKPKIHCRLHKRQPLDPLHIQLKGVYKCHDLFL
jgi:hypothetical protein